MANSKVSNLTAAAALDGTELYYGVQSSVDVKVTSEQIRTLVTSASDCAGATGPGDPIIFTAGDAGVTSGTGGLIHLIGGNSPTSGDGGPILIDAGNSIDSTGGTVDIAGGDGLLGGQIFLIAGSGSLSGGPAYLRSGSTEGAGDAGPVYIIGADAALSSGGNINLWGGSSSGGNGNGGNINLAPGAKNGSGTPGQIILTVPTADPVVAGALWNDSGTLKISAG